MDALVVSDMPSGPSSGEEHGGDPTPTVRTPSLQTSLPLSDRYDQLQTDQNQQGRAHSPMAHSLNAEPVAGRRASSPSSSFRPASPVNRSFLPSSSRPSQFLAAASHSSKASRFSDAFAGLGGRARTLSSASNARRPDVLKGVQSEEGLADSSFGIGEMSLTFRSVLQARLLRHVMACVQLQSTLLY